MGIPLGALEFLLRNTDKGEFAQLSNSIKIGHRFLPPGFRTGNPTHMLVALAYYLFAVLVVWDMKFPNSDGIETVIERVASFLIFIVVALCTCDYGGIQKKLFLCRSENLILRVLGVLILNFTAVAVVVLVAIILCML